ncbi:MAG TPA: hypothetical protein VHV74_11040 [Pseudonocardiaceae bacterium]|nr:hypothetical protein [Pseudonocardiaceae bacterium]
MTPPVRGGKVLAGFERPSADRAGVRLVFWLFVVVLLVAPVLVVTLAGFTSTWNSVLPRGFTLSRITAALSAGNLASLSVSVRTPVLAGALAVAVGTWAAVSVDRLPWRARRSPTCCSTCRSRCPAWSSA